MVFPDGHIIFVRHGGALVRVSPNRLVKAGREFNQAEQETGEHTGGISLGNGTDKQEPVAAQVGGDIIGGDTEHGEAQVEQEVTAEGAEHGELGANSGTDAVTDGQHNASVQVLLNQVSRRATTFS